MQVFGSYWVWGSRFTVSRGPNQCIPNDPKSPLLIPIAGDHPKYVAFKGLDYSVDDLVSNVA